MGLTSFVAALKILFYGSETLSSHLKNSTMKRYIKVGLKIFFNCVCVIEASSWSKEINTKDYVWFLSL